MDSFNFSTFTAISELFVTAGVYYVVFSNFRGHPFRWRLALGLVVFEFSVNMLYMIARMQAPHHAELSVSLKAFAALHGSLSLIVFIMFATCSALAWADLRRGRAFFREHPRLTASFAALWFVSVVSGEALYFLIH